MLFLFKNSREESSWTLRLQCYEGISDFGLFHGVVADALFEGGWFCENDSGRNLKLL